MPVDLISPSVIFCVRFSTSWSRRRVSSGMRDLAEALTHVHDADIEIEGSATSRKETLGYGGC
jgi:hypothetical protein